MHRSSPWSTLAVVCTIAGTIGARAPAAQTKPFDLPAVLDVYAAGRVDEARQAFERVTDAEARDLRAEWALTAPAWINAAPDDRSRRLLVAAALALESEVIRAERGGWSTAVGPSACVVDPRAAGRAGAAGGTAKDKNKPPPPPPPPPALCVIEWARERLVERGSPDGAEHAWFNAAIALAEGVRDFRYLYLPVDPTRQPPAPPGLTDRALERFPGDTRFRLDRAIAAASRFDITTDGAPRTGAPSSPLSIVTINRGSGPPIVSRAPSDRVGARASAIAELSDLGSDPDLGAEARLHLGYLYWVSGNDVAARTELDAAARQARDADRKYLACFLRGFASQSAGDTAAAVAAYTAALTARPNSQSAALALAALDLQRGHAAQADELARASLATRPGDDDPWRLFLYGRYPELPGLMKALRSKVRG